MLAALEVPGVSRVDICPLEISDEDPLEVCPVTDAVVREEFKPRPNMFPHADGEILNDEMVIIHPFGLAGEPEIFETNNGVRLCNTLGVWLPLIACHFINMCIIHVIMPLSVKHTYATF